MASDAPSKKRKRTEGNTNIVKDVRSRKASNPATSEDALSAIFQLESEIVDSKRKYNNIVILQSYAENLAQRPKRAITASVALCRVFCRLIASEKLVKHSGLTEEDRHITSWLKERYHDYQTSLDALLHDEDHTIQSTGLALGMRLVKEETSQDPKRSDQAWRTGTIRRLLTSMLSINGNDRSGVVEEFVDQYVQEYDDVRFYTFYTVRELLATSRRTGNDSQRYVPGALGLLAQVEGIPESKGQLEDWYGEAPSEPKHLLLALPAHKKQAEGAWLLVLRSELSKDQRKRILDIVTTRILPWLTRVENLTDFLTDSYNAGGSTSLLALSGLFYLIQEKNLDYPDFYKKLYSLLDDSIMHSKHRSRFFRLLDTFMASTHLPAALVASFIKRLSRLCLQAPPGGIVFVVPWIYNMFKKHPSCTFMIHREIRDPAARAKLDEEGMDDPFDMAQEDPMLTNAIESSLWEIETLQSHYHPNVATLAKIISEQFTKREYQLEDFLDHSYAGIIDAELGKELKKAPVVEWEIPKHIVTNDEGGLNRIGDLLQAAIEA